MANWGDPWGIPWSGQAEAQETPSGGVYSGFVQPEPGKKRKRPVDPDIELNNLVGKVIEGDAPELGPKPEPAISPADKPTTFKARAEPQLITLDSDDDEAIVLLLAA